MKYPLLIFLTIALTSCSSNKQEVVKWKSYHKYGGDLMPKGICRFMAGNSHEFQDSCHYYYVGDTIANHRPIAK